MGDYRDFMWHCERLDVSTSLLLPGIGFIIGGHTGDGRAVEFGIFRQAEEIGDIERIEGNLGPLEREVVVDGLMKQGRD